MFCAKTIYTEPDVAVSVLYENGLDWIFFVSIQIIKNDLHYHSKL